MHTHETANTSFVPPVAKSDSVGEHTRAFQVTPPETAETAEPDIQARLDHANRFGHDLTRSQIPIQRQVETDAEQEEAEEPMIQTKLTIGQPGDQYEQEADAIAAKVMAMPEPGGGAGEQGSRGAGVGAGLVPAQTGKGNGEAVPVQRAVEEEGEGKEDTLQAKPQIQAKGNAPAVPANFEGQLAQHQGGGRLLSDETRAFMEPRFGADFSHVRIHETPDLANAIQAQAFTHGQDIYFNAGKYNPGSKGGKELLAHELTHVVQQSENQIHRKSTQSVTTYWEWYRSNKGAYDWRRKALKKRGYKIRRLVRSESSKSGWEESNPKNTTLASDVCWSILPKGGKEWKGYTIGTVIPALENFWQKEKHLENDEKNTQKAYKNDTDSPKDPKKRLRLLLSNITLAILLPQLAPHITLLNLLGFEVSGIALGLRESALEVKPGIGGGFGIDTVVFLDIASGQVSFDAVIFGELGIGTKASGGGMQGIVGLRISPQGKDGNIKEHYSGSSIQGSLAALGNIGFSISKSLLTKGEGFISVALGAELGAGWEISAGYGVSADLAMQALEQEIENAVKIVANKTEAAIGSILSALDVVSQVSQSLTNALLIKPLLTSIAITDPNNWQFKDIPERSQVSLEMMSSILRNTSLTPQGTLSGDLFLANMGRRIETFNIAPIISELSFDLNQSLLGRKDYYPMVEITEEFLKGHNMIQLINFLHDWKFIEYRKDPEKIAEYQLQAQQLQEQSKH